MSQKRNRSINWDEEEKQLFRSILKEYAQIIENKSLNTNTNKIKTKAWEEVHKKFNQLNSRPRDLSQLKIQWKTMKLNARKICSNFKKEVNKTGGGVRPTTPNDGIIEVKDLLNPAELLKDHNIYDSDGIIIGEVELSTPCPIKLQDSNAKTNLFKALDTCVNNDTNIENQQPANLYIETIEDIDAQVAVQEFTPMAISQDSATAATPVEKYMDKSPVKNSEDDLTMATPMKKNMGIIPAKKVPKRKVMFNNNTDNCLKSRKDQNDYVSNMLSHSKMLKDEEHMRHMEMAEEEHAIKMEIHREKLKSAILERELLESRKAREAS